MKKMLRDKDQQLKNYVKAHSRLRHYPAPGYALYTIRNASATDLYIGDFLSDARWNLRNIFNGRRNQLAVHKALKQLKEDKGRPATSQLRTSACCRSSVRGMLLCGAMSGGLI